MINYSYKVKNNAGLYDSSLLEEKLFGNGLSEKTIFNVSLVLEEIVTSIMNYSKNTDDIDIEFNYDKKKINIRVADTGLKYNPLELSTPSKKDLDDGNIKGLGIHIAKTKSSYIYYKRLGRYNVLTIYFNVAA
jgi:serine/threonine-protein kinase RsbW